VDLAAGDKLALAPAIQHFQGGVKIDVNAATTVPGLFAAGECAGGQHGANRPGGNALCDCQVFGKIAGESALRLSQAGPGEPVQLEDEDGQEESGKLAAGEVMGRVQALMDRCGGVLRTPENLREGLAELDEMLAQGVASDDGDAVAVVEARSALVVGSMVLAAIERRRESRGPHLMFRNANDSRPLARDDANWRKYIIVSRRGGKMTLDVRTPAKSTE
jgi:succinate dehydrogenase / fumarate reductase flavoprotein subunit